MAGHSRPPSAVNAEAAGPALMAGPPPFPPEARVTLANWQDPPFNRWAFQHIRELIPTARISRGAGPAGRCPGPSATCWRCGSATATAS